MDNVIGDRLHEAKRLINAGRYDEARRTLRPIRQHPKANEWLAKLDKKSPPKNHVRHVLIALVLIALIGGVVTFAALRASSGAAQQQLCALLASQGNPCK